MPDPVVRFELPAENIERAQAFYSKSFGWTVNSIPGMGYTLLSTTATDEAGMPRTPGNINGGMLRRQTFFQSPILTIRVDDMDKALAAVATHGGKVVRDKQPVPGVGFAAYFQDPEGNIMGLVQSAR